VINTYRKRISIHLEDSLASLVHSLYAFGSYTVPTRRVTFSISKLKKKEGVQPLEYALRGGGYNDTI
jgi:hypothetical protein